MRGVNHYECVLRKYSKLDSVAMGDPLKRYNLRVLRAKREYIGTHNPNHLTKCTNLKNASARSKRNTKAQNQNHITNNKWK